MTHKKLKWDRFNDNSAAWLNVGDYELGIYPTSAEVFKYGAYPWRGPFKFDVQKLQSEDEEYSVIRTWGGRGTCATAAEARDAAWALLRRVVEEGR